ncbi:Glutathione S-transferase [Alloalcanivorax dieselolei B5]|uniref:Glutathione S-transferase n=1 Tax=Alcanivorax dieselolei (strain DSM 16502 / CGMCC 1.3690 / MCCC 1A00001 / B-5) TaxID=930169 RepID=K0CK12_ALCDB|nr:glutathione S-transferase N-terminal domain-containing protein [Alloalcanivorax dieselolei]AFT72695.1 Glutathione S-transferase [Alloalcanivorax dieselolei B5]GGJ79900.1 hypothetical protein GCM10007426_06210 [Alloalcanivorax dieselolei]
MTITLYGGEVSYFTGKVRAYLRWADLPFEEVIASADVYGQVILPSVGIPVIPVLRTQSGEILQDTTVITEGRRAACTDKRREPCFPANQTTPCRNIASATRTKPATLAPWT